MALLACGCRAPHDASAPPAAWSSADLHSAVEIEEAAISPDDAEVAFVSDRSGSQELWTVRLSGGEIAATPAQRTTLKQRVSGLAYAPSGDLVFEVDHGGDARPDLWLLPRFASDAAPLLKDTGHAEVGARFSPDGQKLAFLGDVDRAFRFNVQVMDWKTRAVTTLTHETTDVEGLRWSRDGKTIVATETPDDQTGELLVVDVARAKIVKRLAPARADGTVLAVGFLPDDRLLVVATNSGGFKQLATLDVASGKYDFVGKGDWDVEDAALAWDGTLVYSRDVHGDSEVTSLRQLHLLSKEPIRPLSQSGVVDSIAIDRAGDHAVIVRQDATHPPEVLLADTTESRVHALVPADAGRVDPRRLVAAERVTIPSFDATPIDALVFRPRAAATPPATVLLVHGGPDGQSRPWYSPEAQALAAAGFAVVEPNYRGSVGYGLAFQHLNRKDWGGGDLKDALAVVDALGAKGELDPARLGIVGGSYGGYLSLRAITAAPDRFRAAVDFYGMADLVKDWELTSDEYGTWYETQMGNPKDDRALFEDRSPIRALDHVRAPLLVLQGENDSEVPKSESDDLVAQLKALGRDVDYVVYPDEGHGFTHREHQTDAVDRTVKFFAAKLAN